MESAPERRYQVPSLAELEELHKKDPELARRFFDLAVSAMEAEERNNSALITEAIKTSQGTRAFRVLCMLCGTGLALLSLALTAYAIYARADLPSIAIILTGVAGVAGVFLWGYRPKEK